MESVVRVHGGCRQGAWRVLLCRKVTRAVGQAGEEERMSLRVSLRQVPNPQPSTLHPQPPTLNPEPGTLNS